MSLPAMAVKTRTSAERIHGLSNFNVEHMEELQAMKLAPIAANQMQYHPWLPDWQQRNVDFCHAHKIAVTAYFSLGGSINKDKAADLDAIKEIGKAHSTTASQVLLRWALERNVSVIPGTGNPKHMKENLNLYGFTLSSEELTRIDELRSNPIADDFLWVKM
eukprot:TRINITY_DN56673_c0_g1_i1.p4 TRINITY_DN56673_c0_g1~~TRINITY_DN56673_c0_g1_i1.p4  ORF type:complete len:162 (+),score=28.47 TRINITY_DN56673_c0_g1_i1:654-1139(+)